jgi:hypothetical protein
MSRGSGSHFRSRSIVAAFAGLAIALFLVAGVAEPMPAQASHRRPTPTPTPTHTPTPTAAPDFAFGTNYGASFEHYLIRGETWDPHPLYTNCVTYGGPHVKSFSYGSCFFDVNSISVVSLNGYSGTVQLDILGLPPGVTSRTALSLTVRAGSAPAASTGFRLEAATSAPLGTFTATIRGTSGTLTHSVSLPVSVVDQLPPC